MSNNLTDTNVSEESLLVDENSIRDKVYEIRGVKVMLDFELAKIYGYETKNFNRQVKNNAEKFEGDDFMFQLTKTELEEISRCKNFTSIQTSGVKGGRTSLPYAFTEQGIYMLMTVLKGELATKQSRALIMAFKALKDYVLSDPFYLHSNFLLSFSSDVTKRINDITKDISVISSRMSGFVERSEISPFILELGQPETKREFLFLDGQPIKAVDAYISIYSKAHKTIHIIDDYISPKSLHLLQGAQNGVSITLFSDNKGNYLKASDLKDYKNEFPNNPITILRSNNKSHDRFIILDHKTNNERIFHCGASSKDAGDRATAIIEFTDITVKKALSDLLVSMLSNCVLTLK